MKSLVEKFRGDGQSNQARKSSMIVSGSQEADSSKPTPADIDKQGADFMKQRTSKSQRFGRSMSRPMRQTAGFGGRARTKRL